MECKYCDDFTGVCTNGECPMCADACPVPDTEGICKYEQREEQVYKLTPKGCALVALKDAKLIESSLDPAVDAVEVVRRKDCLWSYRVECREPRYACRNICRFGCSQWLDSNDFCSYGERRTDENR